MKCGTARITGSWGDCGVPPGARIDAQRWSQMMSALGVLTCLAGSSQGHTVDPASLACLGSPRRPTTIDRRRMQEVWRSNRGQKRVGGVRRADHEGWEIPPGLSRASVHAVDVSAVHASKLSSMHARTGPIRRAEQAMHLGNLSRFFEPQPASSGRCAGHLVVASVAAWPGSF